MILFAFAAPAEAAVPAHGRVWELVSATDTGGARISLARAWSSDGERIVFSTFGPLPGAASGEIKSHNLATRSAAGWHTVPVTVPHTVPEARFFGTFALAVSADLSSWLWGSLNPLLPGAPENPLLGLYRRDPAGELALIGSLGQEGPFLALTTASSDLGHAGFNSSHALVPADSGRIAGNAAYEAAGKELRLIGVDGDGNPASPCGSIVGGRTQDPPTRTAAMSRDGSRIFFTSPDPDTAACGTPAAVYLREDDAETIAVSASRCTRPDCGPATVVNFAGASGDGSTAYFLTAQQLTNDDTDASTDLYRYEREGETLTRVSAGAAGVEANVNPPIRVAEHGDRVYFRATGSLVPGQSTEGGANLYLREGDGTIRFVGTLAGQSLGNATTDADGSVLLFETNSRLLPEDADTATDVYRYDAAGGTLQRVSAGSGGRGNDPVGATIPNIPEAFPTQGPDALSAAGDRAFFRTTEDLLAEDEDDELDVYEWADGDLGLITPGDGKGEAAAFMGASADGSSVFFETRQALVAEDSDGGEADLYAARLGGGFPPPQVTPECAGEACQGPLSGRLSTPLPATASETEEARKGGLRSGFGFRLSARARRQLATGGRGVAIVRVPSAGRVSLFAFAAIGGGSPVARADAIAWRAGRLAVPFRLGADARAYLGRNHRLRLRLVVRHSWVTKAREAVVTLREPG